MQNRSLLCLTFKRSDSRSAGRKRILSWNSYSRSFKVIHFAIIYRSTRGSISSYTIACRISDVFEDVAKSPKIAVVDIPQVVWRPRPREPPEISAWTLYFQKLESLAYIYVADSMGLSSFKFVQWAPKEASMPQQSVGRKRILTSNSRSWSFKVIHFAIS